MQRNAKKHDAGVRQDSVNLMTLTQFFSYVKDTLELRGENDAAFYFEQLETHLREGGSINTSPKDIMRMLGL